MIVTVILGVGTPSYMIITVIYLKIEGLKIEWDKLA